MQQPLLDCQSLELAIRCFTRSSSFEQPYACAAAAARALTTALRSLTLGASRAATAESGLIRCSSTSTVGVAELQMLRQLPPQRLLSLLLSCLKLAGTSVWEDTQQQQQQQQQQDWLPLRLSTQTAAACVTDCIKLQRVLLRRLTAASGSSSSSSSTVSAAAAAYTASLQEQQLLAVVVARGACMIAECIIAAAAAGAAGNDNRGSVDGSSSSSHERSSDSSSSRQALLQMLTDNTDKVRQVLDACWSSLSWLRSFLSALQMPGTDAAAGAAVLQPLLQQQEQLQREFNAAAKRLPDEQQDAIDAENTGSSISSSSRKAEYAQLRSEVAGQLPRLAEQLIEVADAVCAELPVPLCCNNPSCRSFGSVSELQLVGGKGSICSRCRWVLVRLHLQASTAAAAAVDCWTFLQL
jgi:hypothetical protein